MVDTAARLLIIFNIKNNTYNFPSLSKWLPTYYHYYSLEYGTVIRFTVIYLHDNKIFSPIVDSFCTTFNLQWISDPINSLACAEELTAILVF